MIGGKRPGAGRPADAGERRAIVRQLRCTADEASAWEAAAEAEGVTWSEWARDLMNRHGAPSSE